MKKQLLTLLFLFALTFLQAQDWEEVGTNNTGALISGGNAFTYDIALDSSGNPFIAYSNNGIFIKYFNGSSWEPVGDNRFLSLGAEIKLGIDTNDVLYMAASRPNANGFIEVFRWNGTTWESLGVAGNSAGDQDIFDFKLSPNGELYLAYQDRDNSGALTVKRHTVTGWEVQGATGFSLGRVSQVNLEFTSTGTPYVAYRDEARLNRASVEFFDGTNWVLMGAGVGTGSVLYLDMELDASETPILAYREEVSGRAVVLRFDGLNWSSVGLGTYVSSQDASYLDLEINSNDELHLLYGDEAANNRTSLYRFDTTTSAWRSVGESGIPGERPINNTLAFTSDDQIRIAQFDPKLGRLTVRRYLGDRLWEELGRAQGISTGAAQFTKLAVDNNGVPYVVFQDNFFDGQIGLRRFDGTNWNAIGSLFISEGRGVFPDIAFSSTNDPYVVYGDVIDSKATVRAFDGTNWVNFGTPRFSSGSALHTKIVVDDSNVVYVAYIDVQAGSRITVKFYNQGNWVTLGTEGFSAGTAQSFDFAVAPDGTPYVAYADTSSGFAGRVERFNGTAWEQAGSGSFNASQSTAVSLAINSQGIPHVAFQGTVNLGPRFSRLNGNNWEQVGTFRADFDALMELDLTFDDRDVPYIYYTDFSDIRGLGKVRKLRNGRWEEVGSPGFTLAPATSNSISTFGDRVYVGYNAGAPYVQSIEVPIIPDLPWIETFEDLANGTTIDEGETAWTSTISTQGSFQVQDGKLLLSGATSGSQSFFATEAIDVSGFDEVNIQVTVGDLDQNNKENNDFVRLFYTLDGGPEVDFANLTDDIETQVVSTGPLNGASLRIGGELKVSFDNEFYTIDEIRVEEEVFQTLL